MDWQVHTACRKLHHDPDYRGKEINIVGLSQGGLIARALVERCPDLKVHTLFTFGGPHEGVSEYQKCRHWYCYILNRIVGYLAEWTISQMFVAPADYFRTWWNLPRFYEHSIFLPEINNEGEIKDPGYKARLTAIKNFGMWMWDDDMTVFPKESEWFGDFDEDGNIKLLRENQIYQEDWLGLRELDESGRLFFYHGPGDHMSLEDDMIELYLIPLLLEQEPYPSMY